MEQGREKFRKLAGGGAVASPDKRDPFTAEGLNQMGDGSGGKNRSVYLAVCRRVWSACQTSSPLYKVDVDLPDPDSDDSLPGASPGRATLHRICDLETDMGGKTFVSLQSGWILGVGGNPGGTVIFDTKCGKVIAGQNWFPESGTLSWLSSGTEIFALTKIPDYLDDPNFEPWFEVLDLSNAFVTETAEGVLQLEACSWKELPNPVFFPHFLTPTGFRSPPLMTVRSSVVVGPYMLVSLNQPSNCTFAFDTSTGEWHKIVGNYLPFVGAATQHGICGEIFLAFSHENGPIKAYDIHVSTTSRPPVQDCAIKLSITDIIVRNGEHFEVGLGGGCCISLDREHFSVLFWHEDRGRYLVYDKETQETYPRKLYLKLVTYRTERPVLQGKTPEMVISSQREQTFKICSSLGFSIKIAPIAFALYI